MTPPLLTFVAKKHPLSIDVLIPPRACGSCDYGYRPRTSLALFRGEFGEGRKCRGNVALVTFIPAPGTVGFLLVYVVLHHAQYEF